MPVRIMAARACRADAYHPIERVVRSRVLAAGAVWAQWAKASERAEIGPILRFSALALPHVARALAVD